MSPSATVASARDVAYGVLCDWSEQAGRAGEWLDERLHSGTLSSADRGLARELVYGIIQRQETLDALLRVVVKRPLPQVEPRLLALLRLGAYQLALLTHIPPHAAVHETVELAKRAGQKSWSGFANGVLRSLSREVVGDVVPSVADVKLLTEHHLPLTGGRFRLLESAPFPSPQIDSIGYFTSAFSFPSWLAERWSRRFDFGQLVRLGFWFNTPARMCLRVNSLRGTREQYLARLKDAGIEAVAGEHPQSIWLRESARVTDLPGFNEGWATVQDESAMHAARLLDPQPGESVLDLCAAPGGKTGHLAELMQNRGSIVACDVSSKRLALVNEHCRRLGLGIVVPRQISRDGAGAPEKLFDAVLLDVPCSNTGVLGKRPEVRWRLNGRDIQPLAALQMRLMKLAVSRLKPGGRLVYSTCSIEPEENGQVVSAILSQQPSLQLVQELHHTPGNPADGAYQALIRRPVD